MEIKTFLERDIAKKNLDTLVDMQENILRLWVDMVIDTEQKNSMLEILSAKEEYLYELIKNFEKSLMVSKN